MHDRLAPAPAPRPRGPHLLLLLAIVAPALLLAPTSAAAAAEVPTPAIVPFEDWAPAACPRPTGEDPAPTRRLVVHHTHEPVALTRAEVPTALALTCKAHTDRGFSSIGYHYVVDPWGGVYQGRGALPGEDGRAPTTQAQGAHVAGTNAGAVGVVFLGDHEDAPPTTAALEAATHLLAWLVQDLDLDPDARVGITSSGIGTAKFTGHVEARALSGHSATNHTACPGEHLLALLPAMRNRIRQHVTGAPVAPWGALAVDHAEPAPEPVPTPSPAPTAELTAEPTKRAAAKPVPPLVEEAPPVVTTLGPLVSPVVRLADDLRNLGLASLADRVAGSFGS